VTQPRDDAVDTRSTEDVVDELAEMVRISRTSPTITQRLIGRALVVLYEFIEPGGSLSPFVMRVGGRRWGIEPGSIDPAEADIVIRTSPDTLHRLTSGALGGREAIVSGLLDIRKAPSMPKLLMMRALFNQHRKSRLRAERLTGEKAGGDASARP
jgi:hypothetical protein